MAQSLSPRPGRSQWPEFLIVFFAMAVRLGYWIYTSRTWEDALITLQHAENGARGLGLTHTPAAGPPLHGFTSPLSVLIPLAGEAMHAGWGLAFLRIVSILMGGFCTWLGMRIAQRMALPRAMVLLAGGFLALEHHQIMYGMAGMETQVVVASVLVLVYSLFDMNPWMLGGACGVSLLARPDSIFGVAAVGLLGGTYYASKRRYADIVRASITMSLVYAPWLAFTMLYYGSPVPNTIIAKAYGLNRDWYAKMTPAQFIGGILNHGRQFVFGSLGPAWGGNGVGYVSLGDRGITALLVLVCASWGGITAVRSRHRVATAMTLYAVIYSAYYLLGMSQVYGWYVVPLAGVVMILAACGLSNIASQIRNQAIAKWALAGVAIVLLGWQIALMPMRFTADRNLQAIVDGGVRRSIGEYLGKVAGPEQTIGCEPLGYIGYYSRRIIYDHPGLCSRKVTAFVKQNRQHHTLMDMLQALRPDFIVLRPFEVKWAASTGSWLDSDYRMIRAFRVPDVEREKLLRADSNIDLEFQVFQKK